MSALELSDADELWAAADRNLRVARTAEATAADEIPEAAALLTELAGHAAAAAQVSAKLAKWIEANRP